MGGWSWAADLVLRVGLFLLVFLPTCPAEFSVADLFMNTLRTHFVFACENDYLTIRCPSGTLISIQNANYGRRVPSTDMCPLPWTSLGTRSDSLCSENINCRAADSLQIITDRCEDTPECRIEVKTSLFSMDPCPTTHKYLDVSYKCRPHQFTKVETCEDKHMNVYCDEENQVVAIYNAHFGRLLPGSMECPSYSMHELECQTDDALAQMMQRCHGRRHCAVKAGSKIFGDPCPEDTHKYLIVLYSCVSKSIFRKPRRFPGLPPLPSNRAPDGSSINGLGGAGGGGRGTGGLEPVSGAPFRTLQPSFSDSSVSFSSDAYNDSSYNSYPNSTASIPTGSGSSDTSGLGDFVGSFMIFIEFLKEKKHIFIQYFVIGCLIGIILSLISWVFHLKRKKAKLKKKLRGSDGTDGRQRANGVLAAVQEENRIDIDEIWRSPPPPSILNRVSPTEDDNDNTIWRSHTLPGSRQLNSYYP